MCPEVDWFIDPLATLWKSPPCEFSQQHVTTKCPQRFGGGGLGFVERGLNVADPTNTPLLHPHLYEWIPR
jgi:hypothetical protein